MQERTNYFLQKLKEEGDASRYWWWSIPNNTYLPLPFLILNDDEWNIIHDWFEDTDMKKTTGDINIPFMSVLLGYVMSSSVNRIVQLGHYMGYSALLLGFALRKMGREEALFSIDIDTTCCEYTRSWVKRAGLERHVKIIQGDSADPAFPQEAQSYLGGAPKLVIIDSSHQYEHTLKELNLWFDPLPDDGFIYLHDTSYFAQHITGTEDGCVKRAFDEWTDAKNDMQAINLFNVSYIEKEKVAECSYQDACGLGIIQKTKHFEKAREYASFQFNLDK